MINHHRFFLIPVTVFLAHEILEQDDVIVMRNEKDIKKKLQPLQKRYGRITLVTC